MLIKEYRIPLPLSVEEYRIAQLYMIQKKSREESHGAGSGVEILINEPYTDGPGGSGQYTHKIYHIGSHLPGWFRTILPKSALRVEEKAWNAYPYTRTIYTCPFIEKFSLDIETRYLSDGGEEDNVFSLSETDKRNRIVDILDIVKDPIAGSEYTKEEDPRIFVSTKTGRGPLNDNWLQEYSKAAPKSIDKAIMCAYKLCKVEFKYWGMQSKIERFIHDIGLRKTMVRAHRQAWCWQDEYYGLTIEDIRKLELETQLALQETMGGLDEDEEGENKSSNKKETINLPPQESTTSHPSVSSASMDTNSYHPNPKEDEQVCANSSRASMSSLGASRKQSWGSARSHKPTPGNSDRNLAEWRVESLEKLQTSSSEDEEFFDAQDDVFDNVRTLADPSLFKSSSMEMLNLEDDYPDTPSSSDSDCVDYGPPPLYSSLVSTFLEETDGVSPLDRRVEHYRQLQLQAMGGSHSLDLSGPGTPTPPTPSALAPSVCKTTILFMVLHGGSIMDSGHEAHGTKQSDLGTLKTTFETVIRAHYPAILGHVAVKLIACPAICSETLSLLASLNPYSFDAQSPLSSDSPVATSETLPFGAISLFATGVPEYYDAVGTIIAKGNAAYNEFLRSEEGIGFNGQVCLIGDSVGSILGYDALCKNNPYLISRSNSRYGSHGSLNENDHIESETDRPVSRKTNLETIKQVSVSNPDLTTIGVDENPVKIKPLEQEYPETGGSRKSHNHPHVRHASCPNSRRTSTGSSGDLGKFEFEVTDFFMFGSPLGLVLAYRKMCLAEDKTMYGHMQYLDPLAAVIGYNFKQQKDDALLRPACSQIYNLFYPSDPSAMRTEPLIDNRFKTVPPCKVARYQKFPLGDGQSLHVVEAIQSNIELFSSDHPSPAPFTSQHSHDHPPLERRQSNMSITSQISGHGDYLMSNLATITGRWWGNKRLDYALYCPDALHSFPSAALPYLLHASFWESADVVAFILRQVVRQEYVMLANDGTKDEALFKPTQPREKWLKRRTTIKLRNVAPNHRANDVIVLEDRLQVLPARFMYGPLDMVCLSGERVDVHIMTKPPSGEWMFYGTKDTDSNGRVVFTIPEGKRLPQGMYPVKMVVRGDHTSVDFYLTVLPPKTECVIFSIDGSFTASVSIMAKDPKVRAGAVDVVRYWQEMGYLIIYITARPDMQQKKVVAWLAQHNFPQGMVAFMDGISADPLRQKANYLRALVNEAEIQVHVAYGSNKDITVYQNIGLTTQQIFIVGKVAKKHHKEAQVITDGYAAHLSVLATHPMSRPAVGNARMFIRRSCFSLPGQHKQGSKKAVRKTVSLPQRGSMKESSKQELSIGISESGNTVIDPGLGAGTGTRIRGTSPRVKMSPYRYDATNA